MPTSSDKAIAQLQSVTSELTDYYIQLPQLSTIAVNSFHLTTIPPNNAFLLFYIQSITADDLTKSVFEQQRQLQIQSTGEIAQHVSSDVSLVMSMLYGLANSHYVQQGQLGNDKTTKLLDDTYNAYNLTIDRLFILNKDNIMVNSLSRQSSEFFLGEDLSFRDWVKETRSTATPVFSSGDFETRDIQRIYLVSDHK